VSLMKRDQDGQQQAELKKTLQKFFKSVRENRRLTVRSIAEQVNIDRETVRKTVTGDLDMTKMCAKMVPKELTEEQKQRRVTTWQDLLERQDNILGWSSQVMKHGSTNRTLKQSGKVPNGRLPIPHDQKFRLSKSRVKKMLLTFFDIRGIVHYEFVPIGQTVNQVYYLEVLGRLREKVRRKRPKLFANNSWILDHDNAPAHTVLSVGSF